MLASAPSFLTCFNSKPKLVPLSFNMVERIAGRRGSRRGGQREEGGKGEGDDCCINMSPYAGPGRAVYEGHLNI